MKINKLVRLTLYNNEEIICILVSKTKNNSVFTFKSDKYGYFTIGGVDIKFIDIIGDIL